MSMIHSRFEAIPVTDGKYQVVLIEDLISNSGEIKRSTIIKQYQVYDIQAEAISIAKMLNREMGEAWI